MKVVKKETLLDRWLLQGEMAWDKRLNDAARRIGWFLLNRVNQDTGKCWPSYECLAEDSGLSRATVARAIKLLIECSYFEYRKGGGLQQARCLIPDFDDALYSQEWKEALWARFYTGAPPRQRQSVEQYKIVKRA